MKKKIYSVVKILIFFVLLFLMIVIAARVTERKDSRDKYEDFMELSDQIDVLFFGSSHVLYGVNPVQLYAEYGITSYNMAKQGGMVTESYWTLMNALDYCSPKCIVIDLWALDRDYHYLDYRNGEKSEEDIRNSVSLLHNNMDVWPISANKVAAINDLIYDSETRKEFIWDFTLYHDRWSTLSEKDFLSTFGMAGNSSLLGASQMVAYYPNPGISQPEDRSEVLPDNTVCVQYLYKLLDECQKRGIQVLLTFMPMATSYEQDWQAVGTAQRIANERNIPFLNLLSSESQNVIDYYTDMCDDTHLNNNGMRKVTSYIGGQLCNLYDIPDHRGDEAYATWNEKVGNWQAAEVDLLLNEEELHIELGQIQNVNASAVIFMKGGSQAIQDPIVRRLIKQLTGTSVVDEAASLTGPYLLIRDASGTSDTAVCNYEFGGASQPDPFATILGNTTYIGTSDFGAIYVNEDYENNFLNMEEHYDDDVQILILGQEGEVLGHLFYDPVWNDFDKNE